MILYVCNLLMRLASLAMCIQADGHLASDITCPSAWIPYIRCGGGGGDGDGHRAAMPMPIFREDIVRTIVVN